MGHNKIVNGTVSLDYLKRQSHIQRANNAITKLKFLSINVCGLKSKLKIPEFISLINSYDIIGVQETKLDNADCVSVPGYTVGCQNRKTLSRYRSGGTAIFVRNSILPYIKFGKSNSKLIQWFSIQKKAYKPERKYTLWSSLHTPGWLKICVRGPVP